MADSPQTELMRTELSSLEHLLPSLDWIDVVVQQASRKNPPVLTSLQLNGISETFSAIKSSSPSLIVPSSLSNNVTGLVINMMTVRIGVTARIAFLKATLAQVQATPTAPSPATTPKADVQQKGAIIKAAVFSQVSVFVAAGFGLLGLIGSFIVNHQTGSVNPSYDAQLRSLDKTKESIQSLIIFIDEQKKQLQGVSNCCRSTEDRRRQNPAPS
jgi:hypothetical protein